MFGGIRNKCSQCGGPIVWLQPEDYDAEVTAVVKEATDFMGEPVGSVWRCTSPACDEIGVFGGVHAGF
jgi:hypothetical protein